MSEEARKSRINSALLDISKELVTDLISSSRKPTDRQMNIVSQISEDVKTEIIRRRSSVYPVSLEKNSKQLSKNQNQLTDFELLLLRSEDPIEVDEASLQIITVGRETGFWLNKNEVNNWRGDYDIGQYEINSDNNPEIVKKYPAKKIEYIQELAIRYLKPYTPPPSGDIIIEQAEVTIPKPAPPIIIRQAPPRPVTPDELVIREAPPKTPPRVDPKTIRLRGKILPPPPRKMIIEKLAADPVKPPNVIVERWLPYPSCPRKVIFKTQSEQVVENPKNLIIQWNPPEYEVRTKVRYMGVTRMDPKEYIAQYGSSLIKSKDLPEIASSIETPDDLTLASSVTSQPIHLLEGDLEALNLIDLEAEGLGEYKKQLELYTFSQMLDSVAADKNGKITVNEARSIFNNVNIRLGRTFTINQVDEFFSSLHLNREGRVSFSEFKYAFESIEQVIERKEKIRNRKPTAYVLSGSRTMKCVGDYCTFEDIFEDVDVDGDGMITKEETAKTLLRLNSICRRSYGTDELEIFFSTLDKERKGSIALKDFKEVLTIMENYDDETL